MSDVPKILSEAEIDEALEELAEWELDDDALVTEYVFDDFVEAFGFMASAALLAERSNHHPDWSNVYDTVEVSLSTHEAGGVTRLDVELAREMDAVAGR